jgi:gentisate 1,2-dioxygenase
MTDTGAVQSPIPVAGDAAGNLAVGLAEEDWTGDARFHEYSAAVDPERSGTISAVAVRTFAAALHGAGGTRAVALDLSDTLVTAYPATGPSLLAQFLCIEGGDRLEASPDATSTLLYCLRGEGRTFLEGPGVTPATAPASMRWGPGDVLTIPGGMVVRHCADEDAVLYSVDDSPLLAYLGVRATAPRFAPTRFDGGQARARLAEVAADPGAAGRSRVAVLLGNARNDQTLTATHTLWAMLGVLPPGRVQRAHRHQSIALDLIVDCAPGCYTLVGPELGADGAIVDPARVDWEPGGAFVTPPGLWHSHHNESGAPAHLLPVQDAGLHTYLRTLDIRFT